MMRNKQRIMKAAIHHKSHPPTKEKLESLATDEKPVEWWIGYWEGVKWAYEWVLELS